MTDTVDRGPFAKMLDRQALALQAQIGGSYEQAYTKIYTDPSNRAIVDNARLNHLEQSHDAIYGTRLSLTPLAKAQPTYDPLAKAAEIAENFGPAHAKLHSMAVDHQRAHSGMSYRQAYSHLYSRMENAPLREEIKGEHLRASMAAVQAPGELGKAAAPMDEPQDYVSPGSAHNELNALVAKRMKSDPKLSYERAFTTEYLLPANRTLKSRYDSEPAPAFPAYGR